MTKRILMSSLIGAVVVGGIAVGGLAVASTATALSVDNTSARYLAPANGKPASLKFTADVNDDSAIESLHVVAWPGSSKLDPTAKELRQAEKATCERVSDEKTTCTYALTVTANDGEIPQGTWYVSALATSKDGDTKFVRRAATFEVTR